MGQSRTEDILRATIDGTEYNDRPQSREEELLIELKEAIEAGGGGGGGGTTNYNTLSNKPKINNIELSGNKTPAQLGLQASEEGKGLSSNDYTTDEKTKLAGLSNYDDTALAGRVTANETAISGKVDKETGKGLSTNDYTNADKAIIDGVTTALAGKADADDVIDSATYDSANHQILFKNGTTTLFSLDAAAFVKDGMVDDVEISSGNLVITFNTDAGKQDISIPLTDIFDPANYYDKDDVDGMVDDKADKTDVDSVETMYEEEIHGVNLLKVDATSKTIDGITYTFNANNSITLNGTSTREYAQYDLAYRYIATFTGMVRLNGGLSANIHLYPWDLTRGARPYKDSSKTELQTDNQYNSNGDILFYVEKGNSYIVNPRVSENGTTISNATLYPMLRKANIEDSVYRLYNNQAIQNQINAQGVLGAKNLLSYPYVSTTKTVAGMTYTDNGDGSVTANASTATTGTGSFILQRFNAVTLPKGRYIITDNGSSITDLYVAINKENTSGEYVGDLTRLGFNDVHEAEFTVDYDGYPQISVLIYCRANVTVNNLVFKPMLRLASDPDDTYQPYAMTNRELTELAGRTVEYPTEWNSDLNLDTNFSSGRIHRYGKIYLIDYWFKATTDISGNTPIIKLPKNGLICGNYVIAVNNDGAVWGGKASKDGNEYISISCPIVTGNFYRAQCIFIDPS